MGYTLHFISHTHWDREWYMSFEQHRIRLVELMDRLIDALDKNPDFKSFHMDGQVIMLEDYLEIKPYMLDKIKKYISEGRLKIGPWYVLQDEFLISGEANVRNMLYGIRTAGKYGPVSMIGYFPDAFGNISQAPQILRGFGIDNAVFGRGVNPIGADNTVVEYDKPEEYNSELIWKSPDGSEVLGILFANWYHNAWEVPAEPQKAREYIAKIRDKAAKVAATPHLLMMNGCDHQPVQVNLPEILKAVQDELPEDVLLHSSLDKYVETVRKYKQGLKIVEGELTSQFTDGRVTLVNTASSRIYLKQLNHRAQNLLEKWVEPFGTISWMLGDGYRKDFIHKAWIYLMQNHPHDSICGCSTDDVHEEMVTRFKKSIGISEELIKREMEYLVSRIDTSSLNSDEIPLVVFNPHLWDATELVTAYIDFDEGEKVMAECLNITDSRGNPVSADFAVIGRTFTYTLPDDSFRKVKYVNRFEVRFTAVDIPGLGYQTYIIGKNSGVKESGLSYGDNYAENEFLRMDINSDGSIRVINKENGYVFDKLNIFEDSRDIGDEYNYVNPEGDKAITSENSIADVSILKAGKAAVTFRIRHSMNLPEKAEKTTSSRNLEYVKLTIDSFVTLGSKARRIDITTEFDNNVCDHRLRALFPTNLQSEYCYADGQFDVVKRAIEPWVGWKNPSNCQRQQAFADICDGQNGLVIANKGLPEYEVLRDGKNTIAITLVRAVGELGDWGYFPTPDAQCQGLQRVEYSIVPYEGDEVRAFAHRQARQFNVGLLKTVQTGLHEGKLGLEKSFVSINAKNIAVSAMKKCEDRDGIVLRLYNPGTEDENFEISLDSKLGSVYETDMNEERLESLKIENRKLNVFCPAKKIMTIELCEQK